MSRMSEIEHADSVLAELYGAMQTFRRLGFPADNLYLANNIVATFGPYAGKLCIGVQLRWLGKEFNDFIAPVKDYEAFAARWEEFAEFANAAPPNDAKLRAIVANSFCWSVKTDLIAALVGKGILPPGGTD